MNRAAAMMVSLQRKLMKLTKLTNFIFIVDNADLLAPFAGDAFSSETIPNLINLINLINLVNSAVSRTCLPGSDPRVSVEAAVDRHYHAADKTGGFFISQPEQRSQQFRRLAKPPHRRMGNDFCRPRRE